ncbi:hypothetical protein [Desulfobacter postgatei]|uniref:hypothetical protein n=1 Tax=Desulfobacter postgatei TaxID=2293 RepID=UPI00259B3402|nr:hypothetical protein [uncultured Desulfobacter sp.]
MTPKTDTRRAEGNGAPGQESVTVNGNSTTAWCSRQLVKIAPPWIAAIITSTHFTARKSLFLDRLIIMAGGGRR